MATDLTLLTFTVSIAKQSMRPWRHNLSDAVIRCRRGQATQHDFADWTCFAALWSKLLEEADNEQVRKLLLRARRNHAVEPTLEGSPRHGEIHRG